MNPNVSVSQARIDALCRDNSLAAEHRENSREQLMKQKLGTVIESDILRRAKRQVADEDRPLSDPIQDALDRYLMAETPTPDRRDAAYSLFCEQPMRITPEQFRDVLQADSWDT